MGWGFKAAVETFTLFFFFFFYWLAIHCENIPAYLLGKSTLTDIHQNLGMVIGDGLFCIIHSI